MIFDKSASKNIAGIVRKVKPIQTTVKVEILASRLLFVVDFLFISIFCKIIHAAILLNTPNADINPACSVQTKVLPQYVEALRADKRVGF